MTGVHSFFAAALIAAGSIALCVSSAPARCEAAPQKMTIRVNGRTLTATLADNSSAAALVQLLEAGSVTLPMHDYGSFEKVGPLPVNLPTNDEPLDTDAGDLILYQGRQFVLYYDRNSWTFTRLGRVEDIGKEELKTLLGPGSVTAVLSLAE